MSMLMHCDATMGNFDETTKKETNIEREKN